MPEREVGHCVRMELKLTREESELLDAQAEAFGVTRSGLLRLALHAIDLFQDELDGGPERILYLDPKTWRLMLIEFRMHGVNLNQCARACNSIARDIERHAGEIIGDDWRIREILATLRRIEQLAREMMAKLRPLENEFRTALACKQLIKVKKEYEREWAESRQRSRKMQNRR